MEVGILNLFGARPEEPESATFSRCLTEALAAEEYGFDAVWLGEFHFSHLGVSSSPLTIASAIAQRTSRVMIGTAISVLPLAHPVQLVEAANTVDHLSEGRFHLGIGRGTGLAYEGYGYEYNPRTEENRRRFIECAEIVMRCLREDAFSFEGEFYRLQDVIMKPRSRQQPHLPVSAAAGSPQTYREMGQRGISLLLGATLPSGHGYLGAPDNFEAARERIAIFEESWKLAQETTDSTVTIRVPCFVAETRERAVEGLAPGFQWSQDHALEVLRSLGGDTSARPGIDPAWAEGIRQRATRPIADLMDETAIVGTPETVREGLLRIKEELRPDALIVEMNFLQQAPLETVLPAYRLFADEVLPALK